MPALSGDSLTQASYALQAAGLVLGSVSYGADFSCNNIGAVKWQSPAKGTRTTLGAAVSVGIGDSSAPTA